MRLLSLLKVVVLSSALALPFASPALAGSAENAVLAKYEGTWKGAGKVAGPKPGSVSCRLTFKSPDPGKLTYSGRCTFGAGGASFRGIMLYNDAKKRYESSATAQGVSTTIVGKKSGGGVVFAGDGMKTSFGTASSTMALAGNSIKMSFSLVDKKGAKTSSSITFSKN